MDYHVIIVIACVFLASLFSILFINKFFKNKTYEEAAAEKKALVEKLYPSKVNKKVKKFTTKRDSKKDNKKQRQLTKDSATENDVLDSDDIEEEETQSIESSPSHNVKAKPHVEFSQTNEPSANHGPDQKGNKQGKKKSTKAGILVNKSETSPVQENVSVETLNHFEKQHPKDFVELKKPHKDEANSLSDGKNNSKNHPKENGKKPNKPAKKENIEQVTEIVTVKETKTTESKPNAPTTAAITNSSVARTESPKSQGNKKSSNSNKSKPNHKEVSLFDKIGSNDVIGVNSLMQLFAKAELNRNDIQLLIDFLLNKQQDTAVVAHEWSDDVVTKLRKQLSEKEKALQEETEASAGIQAKLKDLRVEINTERAQFHANMKAYTEELQSKKNEIAILTSEIQNMNEKLQLERQQFQVKMRHEKQLNTQDFLAQIQQLSEHNTTLQTEVTQKNTYINELQRNANALVENFEQKLTAINENNEGKIKSLESNLSEANETIQRLQYDLEMAKIAENEKESSKVEIRNLQNALETTRAELICANKQLDEKQVKISTLTQELKEMRDRLDALNQKCQENSSETVTLKNSVENYNQLMSEKDTKLSEYESKIDSLVTRERDLMNQITEQKEKNNMTSSLQTATSGSEEEIRNIFQRLFPDAVKKHSSSALSTSFEQWIEQIILTHTEQINEKNKIKLEEDMAATAAAATAAVASHKNSENNDNCNNSNNNNNNHHSPHNHNSVSSNNSKEDVNISNSSSNSSNINDISNDNNSGELLSQNIKLKAQIEELTSIVNKQESMLKNMETQAREQDANLRMMIASKQDEINLLRNANGETY